MLHSQATILLLVLPLPQFVLLHVPGAEQVLMVSKTEADTPLIAAMLLLFYMHNPESTSKYSGKVLLTHPGSLMVTGEFPQAANEKAIAIR